MSDDRLTFGEGPLGGLTPEPEPEPERRPNRAFVFIAVAMGGLILLGVLALVAALTFVVPNQRQQREAAVAQTVAAATQQAAAWTPTFTPSPTAGPPTATVIPTWTPIPTATATRVVSEEEKVAGPTATPTRSAGQEWGGTTPSAGLGGFGAVAIAVGLTGLLFSVRRLRLGR